MKNNVARIILSIVLALILLVDLLSSFAVFTVTSSVTPASAARIVSALPISDIPVGDILGLPDPDTTLSKYTYSLINAQVQKAIPSEYESMISIDLDHEDIKAILDDTAFKNFLSEKTAAYATVLLTGSGTASISAEELVSEFESILSPLADLPYAGEQIYKEATAKLTSVLASFCDQADANAIYQLAPKAFDLVALLYSSKIMTMLLVIGVTLVLLLILVNLRRIYGALISIGVPSVLCGTVGILVSSKIPEIGTRISGKLAMAALLTDPILSEVGNTLTQLSMMSACIGAALILVGIVLHLTVFRTTSRKNTDAPESTEEEVLIK